MVKRAPPLAGGRGEVAPNGEGDDAGCTGEVLAPNVNAGAALFAWGSPARLPVGEAGWLPPKLKGFDCVGVEEVGAAVAPNENG